MDPLIFWAVLNLIDPDGTGGSKQRRLDRDKPTHVRVGDAIATFCSSVNQRDCLPVVLIVGPFDKDPYRLQLRDSADHFGHCPPFSRTTIPNSIDEAIPSSGSYRYYPRLLVSSLEQYDHVRKNDIHLPSICALPLLRLSLFTLRCRDRFLRETFDSSRDFECSSLDEEEHLEWTLSYARTLLRLGIVDAEKDWCSFVRYMSTHLPNSSSAMPFREDYEGELKNDTAEADRLESQVRDYMQLQVGTLSLRESRNSIELSNRQMEENKRGEEHWTLFVQVY